MGFGVIVTGRALGCLSQSLVVPALDPTCSPRGLRDAVCTKIAVEGLGFRVQTQT